jgi:hypothetical protein
MKLDQKRFNLPLLLSFLVPFRSMVRGSSHPSVDILVLVPYSNHGTRTRMSTDKSRASNQRSSTRSRRGFCRRAGLSTRSRRGFCRIAKTRTRTRRVVLSPRSTALYSTVHLHIPCKTLAPAPRPLYRRCTHSAYCMLLERPT